MRDSLDLCVLRTTAELESIEPAWLDLWQSDADATPFQNPAWLLPWWRQFASPHLRTIAMSQSGKLIGLLPFYIYSEPHTGTRQLLLLGAGTSDYLDGIFAPSCTPAHIRTALSLLGEERDWDVASLVQLRPASMLLQAFADQSAPILTESCSRMNVVDVSALPRNLRQNIAYYRNRAQRLGTLNFNVATQSDCPALFDELVSLHSHRWQERGQSGVLSDPRVLAWHRDALPRLARQGLLRLCALRHNSEVIASLYGFTDPPRRPYRTLYVYLPAFSTRHAAFSPGTLLLAYTIEQAAAEGIQILDMLRGDERYKQLWHMEKAPTFGFQFHSLAPAAATTLVEAA